MSPPLIPARLSVEGWGMAVENDSNVGYALLDDGNVALILPPEAAQLALQMLATLAEHDESMGVPTEARELLDAMLASLKNVRKT